MHRLCIWALLFLTSAAVFCAAQTAKATSNVQKMVLRQNWQLQSSCKVSAKGERISGAAFTARGWHSAQVPSTVLAALVADKTFPDPYFGMNLRSIPGTTYPIAT